VQTATLAGSQNRRVVVAHGVVTLIVTLSFFTDEAGMDY
jgi:hypothetical protein